jgi:hypothetical protein
MANYTIIGGDKKEYGPVSPEDMRQWIAEGRLDGNTLARSENDTEWRPLSTFPEFSLLFHARPQSPPPINSLRRPVPESSAQEVRTPAICLLVTAGLNVLLGVYTVIKDLFFPENMDQLMAAMPAMPDPQAQKMASSLIHLMTGPVAVGSHILALLLSVVVLVGAIRMLALRNYEFAMVAAILAIIPCATSCCALGLPFGIWALIVLRRPGIKDQFN